MGTTKTARHPQDATPPTFESVWALIQENARKNALEMEKFSEKMDELRESQKETDRIVKETSRKMGDYSNRIGKIAECIVAPNLRDKFRKLGFTFNQTNRRVEFGNDDGSTFFEVDVLLENGDKALLVEIKVTPTTEDVKEHIKRLGKMRVYADRRGDKRAFLGAVSGVVITDAVRKYVLKHGLYLIEPSGETFNIIPPTGSPKEW